MAMQNNKKPQRFTFTVTCMTKDNQLAVCSLMVLYHSTTKMDSWFNGPVSKKLERMVEDYVADTYLYDVTTDRNPAKDLINRMTEVVKTALKQDPKPAPTIKLAEVALIIRRDR